jgi:hypothetical protein
LSTEKCIMFTASQEGRAFAFDFSPYVPTSHYNAKESIFNKQN